MHSVRFCNVRTPPLKQSLFNTEPEYVQLVSYLAPHAARVWSDTRHAMQEIEEYSGLPDDLVGASKRWIEWLEFERPEDEPLPGALSCI